MLVNIENCENTYETEKTKDLLKIYRRNCQMLWMKNPEICLGCNL